MDKAVERALFDETFYLRLYPSVAQAVARGQIKSGWAHYDRHGRAAGRRICDFDDAFYLQSYPTAAEEIRAGLAATPIEHFAMVGRRRGYAPSQASRVNPGRQAILDKIWHGRDPMNGFPENLFEGDSPSWKSQHAYLEQAISDARPTVIVEIGVWKGATTLFMANELKRHGLPSVVIAIDTWLGSSEHWLDNDSISQMSFLQGYPAVYQKFMSNVMCTGLADYIVPLPLDSLSAAELLKARGIHPAIIHLDAGHGYDSVVADLGAWWPVLAPGGLLIGNGYHADGRSPGVRRAFDDFFGARGVRALENAGGNCRVGKQAVEAIPTAHGSSSPPVIAKPGVAPRGDAVPICRWDARRALDLASAGKIADLADLIDLHFGRDCCIRVEVDEAADWRVARWEALGPRESRIVAGRAYRGGRQDRLNLRLFDTLPLVAAYHRAGGPENGSVHLSLEDYGINPGLAYCGNGPEFFLIPDRDFIHETGYEVARRSYAANDVTWAERAPVALWRGSEFGPDNTVDWRDLPRVKLCAMVAEGPHRNRFDVGISNLRMDRLKEFSEEIRTSGLMRDVVPAAHFNRYRYQIDIDGRTNAWSGLFQKLLTGSPVLKVASQGGYRQWYYHRLEPWVNYVPVAADMHDLIEKVEWLIAHDEEARMIGTAGRALAQSLTYDAELRGAAGTIGIAMKTYPADTVT